MNKAQGDLLVKVLHGLLDHAEAKGMPGEKVKAVDGDIKHLAHHLGLDDAAPAPAQEEEEVKVPTED